MVEWDSRSVWPEAPTSFHFTLISVLLCRSQQPRGLRRRSAAARLLRSWVRIPPGTWMSVCCECCVLSGRGSCDELITRPEKSYRLWCVVVCDLETSWMRPYPTGGCRDKRGEVLLQQSYILFVHLFIYVTRLVQQYCQQLTRCGVASSRKIVDKKNNFNFVLPCIIV